MARRTGIPTILEEAQSLQNHLTAYQPTIQSIHPTNTDLLDAITSCATCLVNLIQEVSAVRERGD